MSFYPVTGIWAAKKAAQIVGESGGVGESGLPDVVKLSGASVALEMKNNVEYHCTDAVSDLTIQGFDPGEDGKVSIWAVQFTAADSITATIPDNVRWSIAEPVFVPNVSYWLSFVPLVNDDILGVWVSNE